MKEMEVNGWKFFGMYGHLVTTPWLSYLLFAATRLNITQINEFVVETPPTQDSTTRKDPTTKPAPKRPRNTATSDSFDHHQCAVNFFLDKYGKGIEPKQNQQHRSVNTGLSLIGRTDKDTSLQLISPRAWGLGWLWNSQDKKDAWYKLANNLGTLALYICSWFFITEQTSIYRKVPCIIGPTLGYQGNMMETGMKFTKAFNWRRAGLLFGPFPKPKDEESQSNTCPSCGACRTCDQTPPNQPYMLPPIQPTEPLSLSDDPKPKFEPESEEGYDKQTTSSAPGGKHDEPEIGSTNKGKDDEPTPLSKGKHDEAKPTSSLHDEPEPEPGPAPKEKQSEQLTNSDIDPKVKPGPAYPVKPVNSQKQPWRSKVKTKWNKLKGNPKKPQPETAQTREGDDEKNKFLRMPSGLKRLRKKGKRGNKVGDQYEDITMGDLIATTPEKPETVWFPKDKNQKGGTMKLYLKKSHDGDDLMLTFVWTGF